MAVATSISTRPAFQPSQDAIRSVCALQLGLNMIEAVSEHGPAGLRDVIEKARSNGSILSAVYGLEMACDDVDAVRESLIPLELGLSWLAELIENDIDGLMTVVDKAVMDGTIIEAAAYAEVARDIIERQPGF